MKFILTRHFIDLYGAVPMYIHWHFKWSTTYYRMDTYVWFGIYTYVVTIYIFQQLHYN